MESKKKQRPITPEEAYRKATTRCAAHECCRSEWRTKFKRQGLSNEQIEELLDRLEDEGYIDEARYARAFAHDKVLYGHCGRIKVLWELRAKGIGDADLAQCFEWIAEGEYEDILQKLLMQKRTTLHLDDPREEKQKLAQYAIGRGFEPELVFNLLKIYI